MPVGRPSLYDSSYCDTVVKLGAEGKSQVQIACTLGVDPASLRRWQDENEEFRLALTRAKAEEQNWWETVGQTALFADKFNSAVWSKSMSARFRDDYTDRQKQDVTASVTHFDGSREALDKKLDGIANAGSESASQS